MMFNKILTAANAFLTVTNLHGISAAKTQEGVPLGTVGGSATGELAVKVISVGGSAATTQSSTATTSNVTALATSVLLDAANTSRKGLTIYNHCDKVLHVSFTSPASANNSVADLVAETAGVNGGRYEVPFGYTGAVYGIWEAAPTGKANITELT